MAHPRLAPDRAALGGATEPEESLRAAWPTSIGSISAGSNAQGKALGAASISFGIQKI
jgi:hypothetical protein